MQTNHHVQGLKCSPLQSTVYTTPSLLKRDQQEKWKPITRSAPDTREIALTQLFLGMTLIAWAFATWELIDILWHRSQALAFFEQTLFILLVQSLIYGNGVYQLTRLGALKRRAAHCPASREALEAVYGEPAPALTVLALPIRKRSLSFSAHSSPPHSRIIPTGASSSSSPISPTRKILRIGRHSRPPETWPRPA